METGKAGKILNIFLIVFGAVLSLGVKFVFHACAGEGMDGMEKSCQTAESAVFAVGLIILILAIVMLFVKGKHGRAVISVLITALAVFAAVIPNHVIRLCQMPGMRCLTVMQPAVILLGILTAIVAVISFVVSLRK